MLFDIPLTCYCRYLPSIAFVLLNLSYTGGAVEITKDPSDVTAVIGQSALISCEYEGGFYPNWIINGHVFAPLELPPHYINLYKQGLKIPYVEEYMNNTDFMCAFSTQLISESGHLTVIKQCTEAVNITACDCIKAVNTCVGTITESTATHIPHSTFEAMPTPYSASARSLLTQHLAHHYNLLFIISLLAYALSYT